jgi:hypothetical protein
MLTYVLYLTQLNMPPRQAFTGSCRKLVFAFDVGTTFSGVSYCFLDPGQVPVIQGVNRYDSVSKGYSIGYLLGHRFPAQEHVGGDCKIPSIICYDPDGAVRAVGAEAMQESVEEEIDDNGWVKLEWLVSTTH